MCMHTPPSPSMPTPPAPSACAQNADDNHYDEGVVPEVFVDIVSEATSEGARTELVFSNNEVGF